MKTLSFERLSLLIAVLAAALVYAPCSSAQFQSPRILYVGHPVGYVDAFEDQSAVTGQLEGIPSISITFSEPVVSRLTGSYPTLANFEISYIRNRASVSAADLATGTAPSVALVENSGASPYTLVFSPRIPLGAWTVIRIVDLVDFTQNPLMPLNPMVAVGSLPMDISGDGRVLGNDINTWLGIKSGAINPAPLTILDRIDITRDMQILGNDVNRAIQLLNGVATNRAWANFSIGPLSVCGDGMLEPGEECDDGNTATGDGCNALCAFEPCGSVWSKYLDLAGRGSSMLSAAVQLADGSYVAAGEFWAGGDEQALLVKFDANGNTCLPPSSGPIDCANSSGFIKTFGGMTWYDRFHHVERTADGGFLLVGFTYSYPAVLDSDIWVIKTDANGDTCNYGATGNCTDTGAGGLRRFARTFGSPIDHDVAYWGTSSFNAQSQPDGYVIGGYSYTFGPAYWSPWLIKTDLTGATCDYSATGSCTGTGVFARTYAYADPSSSGSIMGGRRTPDGGYILTGLVNGDGGDFMLLKVDSNGGLCTLSSTWECSGAGTGGQTVFAKRYGSTGGTEQPRGGVELSPDGGYLMAGLADDSFGATGTDYWIVKTDSLGQTCNYSANGNCTGTGSGGAATFAKRIGLSADYNEWPASVRQAGDGGYIIAGELDNTPAWLLKLGSAGTSCNLDGYGNCEDSAARLFSKKLPLTNSSFLDAIPTADGGYLAVGHDTTVRNTLTEALIVKTNSSGKMPYECAPP